MPIYTYQCEDCGVRFDARQKFSDDPLSECPECSGHVHRVPQPVGIVFKGSGWYVKDSKGKNTLAVPPNKKDDASANASASDSTDSASAKSDTSSSDPKPAKKDSSSDS